METVQLPKTTPGRDCGQFIHHKKGKDSTSIWFHFLIDKNGQCAKCKLCAKALRCGGGSTKGLHTHLKSIHKHEAGIRRFYGAESAENEDDPSNQPGCSASKKPKTSQPKPIQSLITCHLKSEQKESLSEVLARMTSCDGLPFNIFCTSYEIRQGLIARQFNNLPKSPNTIRTMVLDYSKFVKSKIFAELSDFRNKVCPFDEWSSLRNRRYMNINIHLRNGSYYNMGLVRMHGSMPAEKCVELLRNKLKDFGLDLSTDIVTITTDGASVMVKVGKLIEADQQLCFAHGIHLAVLDVLYRVSAEPDNLEESDAEKETEIDDYESESDEENDVECSEGFVIENTVPFDVVDVRHLAVNPLVKKIRKVVKMFRRSPSQNDECLQKYVKSEFGKEIMLLLDLITRWNTLLIMLERFYEVRYCVQKALIDLKSNITFSEDEFGLLFAAISTFMPIKLAVEAICRRDANLLTADAALKFMMSTIDEHNSQLSTDLTDALKKRIFQRRTDLSQVLYFF